MYIYHLLLNLLRYLLFLAPFSILLFTFKSFALASEANSVLLEEISKESKQRTTYLKNQLPFKVSDELDSLLPIPSYKNEELMKSLRVDRNPFSTIGVGGSQNNERLPSTVRFNGIAKIGDETVAIISSKSRVEIYKVGQNLGRGYSIVEIDANKALVKISNGRQFKLIRLEK